MTLDRIRAYITEQRAAKRGRRLDIKSDTCKNDTQPPLGKEADKPSIYQRITIEEAKQRLRSEFEPPWDDIDPGILYIVRVLFEEGVETTESCQGGPGHPFAEATVKFCGEISAGPRAFAIAVQYNLRPMALRRTYQVIDKELVGPEWEMTFYLPGYPFWNCEWENAR